nr:glucoamylase S1-like [Penaeus vannamei]
MNHPPSTAPSISIAGTVTSIPGTLRCLHVLPAVSSPASGSIISVSAAREAHESRPRHLPRAPVSNTGRPPTYHSVTNCQGTTREAPPAESRRGSCSLPSALAKALAVSHLVQLRLPRGSPKFDSLSSFSSTRGIESKKFSSVFPSVRGSRDDPSGSTVIVTSTTTAGAIINTTVGATITTNVGVAINTTVGDTINSTGGATITTTVGVTINTTVDDTINSTVGATITTTVGGTISTTAGVTIKTTVGATITTTNGNKVTNIKTASM